MKKSLLIIAALLLVSGLAMANDVYGILGTPASHDVTITVTIPPRVGISIAAGEHLKALTLAGDITYPPDPLPPTDYWPIGTTNLISILSTGNFHYGYTISAATALLPGLAVNEFEYSLNTAAFVPFALLGGVIDPAASPRTAGWVARNMDYRVALDGNETAGINTLVVTYTITAE